MLEVAQHQGALWGASWSVLLPLVTLLAADRQSDVSLLKEPDCPSPRQPATGRRHSAAHQASSWSPGAVPEGPAGHMEQVLAKLQLVDLAGSECAGEPRLGPRA